MRNIYDPDFYIYYDKDKDIITLGCMWAGYTITKAFTIDEWFTWLESETKDIKRTDIPSSVKRAFGG